MDRILIWNIFFSQSSSEWTQKLDSVKKLKNINISEKEFWNWLQKNMFFIEFFPLKLADVVWNLAATVLEI